MNTFVALLSLSVVLVAVTGQNHQGGPHEAQGGPHQHQGRIRREAEDAQVDEQARETNWTECDTETTPRISCHDCHTRLVCKPVGGILTICRNPIRPHCNNGTCSAEPSAECA